MLVCTLFVSGDLCSGILFSGQREREAKKPISLGLGKHFSISSNKTKKNHMLS